MKIGKVTGSVWATKKDELLNGQKLLVVQTDTHMLVATDRIGAGMGDTVLLCYGSSARFSSSNHNAPIDAAIVGIIDTVELEEHP